MTRPLALVFCAAFVLSSHAASAKPKVALTQIEGDASGDLRDAVVEALEGGKELSLISGREVNRAVDKLGDLADLTEKDFKKLANELEADAIVLGKLDKVGSSKTLRFRLYVHKKMAKGFTVSFKDAKSEKFRSLLHDKILDKIGVAASGDGDDEKPAKKKKGGDDDEDPLATKKDKPGRDKKARKAKGDDEEETKPKRAKVADDDDGRPKRAKVADDDDGRPKRAKVADDEDGRPKRAKVADDEDGRPKRAKVADDDDGKPAAPSDDDGKPAKRTDSDDEPAPRRSKKKVTASDDGQDEVEAGVATTVEPPHTANRVAVRADVGVSVLQRSFKFNSRVFNNQPKGTSLPPLPGVHFEAELYPLAFSTPNSAAAGLGIGVEYDKTLAGKLSTTQEPNVAVPVSQSHYSLALQYRLAFGSTATSPTLTIGAGYGKRQFTTDRSKLIMDASKSSIMRDTPDTKYTVIDPGLTLRLPVTKLVAVSFGGRGMIITDAGYIQSTSSYGRAKVFGAEAGASVDIVLGSRFALRFAGEFVQVGFAFTGVGALSNNLDADPTTPDVGGLADRSISGYATLAVMY